MNQEGPQKGGLANDLNGDPLPDGLIAKAGSLPDGLIAKAGSTNKSRPQEASYLDMEFAKLDLDRKNRCGFPEVVFCESKPDEYIVPIFQALLQKEGHAFGTRATKEQYRLIRESIPDAEYDPISRIIRAGFYQPERKGLCAVCCAGTADIPVAEEAAQTAEYFGTNVERVYDVGVSGLHRLLSKTESLRKADCIIAVAGMEGALASVIGGLVENPVIAVPSSVGYGASFGGLSALLTMINSCANGICVVNIDNGFGAGYLAAQINRLAERSDT
ncbi:MAG: nickel pincer cofactor biosynthesis protein LarB [Lachnospiraceae bacterium]|nr:nickel pincer cofactor biosynthesis protein LarB [Lachnospiraceae bacterium]